MVQSRDAYETVEAYYLALIEEMAITDNRHLDYADQYRIKNLSVSEAIEGLDRSEQRDLALAMLQWCITKKREAEAIKKENEESDLESVKAEPQYSWRETSRIYEIFLRLTQRKLPFDHDSLIQLINQFCTYGRFYGGGGQLIKAVQNYLKDNALSPDLEQAIATTCQFFSDRRYSDTQTRKHLSQLQKFLPQEALELPLIGGEYWSDQAIATLTDLPQADHNHWSELLGHCALATASKPSKTWSKKAATLLEKMDGSAIAQNLITWFPLVDKPRTQPLERRSQWQPDPNLLINDRNADILKGLVWLCPSLIALGDGQKDTDLMRAIMGLALSAYRKVPEVGPRCVRVGNACVWALGEIPGTGAIAQLEP